jgi:hypothetical protein
VALVVAAYFVVDAIVGVMADNDVGGERVNVIFYSTVYSMSILIGE